MLSRSMLGIILQLLEQAHLDRNKLSMIMIGDSSQLQPIGGVPSWSISTKRQNNKDHNQYSTLGMIDFRGVFGMQIFRLFLISILTK